MAAPLNPNSRRREDWYSLSVESVRLWLGAAVCLLTVLGFFFGFSQWREYRVEQSALEWAARARNAAESLATQDLSEYRSLYDTGRALLGEANTALESSDFRRAGDLAQESWEKFESINNQVRHESAVAWFVGIEGDVRYRHGEEGEFLRAFPQGLLSGGDYVRSGNRASAEIHFRREQARFTLRPGSLIKLSANRQGAESSLGFIEYGWVALDTSGASSRVETPHSNLRVGTNSSASIALNEGSESSLIRVHRGTARVTSSSSGEVRELGELQQISLSNDVFSEILPLPGLTLLERPEDNETVNIDSTDRLELGWREVPGASRYALQVSRSRLFGNNIIDTDSRPAPAATLGLAEQGSYSWRVAAYNKAGTLGPWSDPRTFRVSSFRNLAIEGDSIPPSIEVEVVMNGNIAILRGRCEPGSRLEVNGKTIELAADGSFSTSQVVFETGQVALVFVRHGRRPSILPPRPSRREFGAAVRSFPVPPASRRTPPARPPRAPGAGVVLPADRPQMARTTIYHIG